MDVDDFWGLIERSGVEAGRRKARVAWLVDELSRRPVEEIVDYEVWWTITQNRGCTVDLYAAYWFVFLSGSLDGFEYFVSWLVSLGRETFESVADCPDRLIEVPQVLHLLELDKAYASGRKRRPSDPEQMREESPEFEVLAYVAHHAYERVTGQGSDGLGEAAEACRVSGAFPLVPAIGGVPRGEDWDFDDEQEVARRLPRIARHLGLRSSPTPSP
ncbi:DUF4240 domain-containing protein [Nonomuraea sp. SMC257]|uniref:DUF4240 domain-containing protein n=1 Tax=Nonomuraea montanisoli TaxID=2741721 RepID=A0A7Y6I428_9ACTN|nr:DUF4240 domain-containing protein [Nonomuraea montanisoli]NUW30159.1 DUF4240 domain-containing protein [Nonomuraea montanisoli]